MKKLFVLHQYSDEYLAKAWQLIEQAQSITLLTHQDPDADGMSACAALSYIFTKLKKNVETIYPTKPAREQKMQAHTIMINNHSQIPDLIIACDTANYERLYLPEAFKKISLINIDHHVSNSIQGDYNFVNAQASSTCEELYTLFRLWNVTLIDQYVAECLLYGTLYDTQIFRTQSTTSNTLRLAADLMDYGVDLFSLKLDLLAHKNTKNLILWGSLLSNITTSVSGNALWVVIQYDDLKQLGLKKDALAGFSNLLAELTDVDITIVFYESEFKKTEVSIRSKKSDVNSLAGKFGGGGHKNASGISSDIPVHELIKKMIEFL